MDDCNVVAPELGADPKIVHRNATAQDCGKRVVDEAKRFSLPFILWALGQVRCKQRGVKAHPEEGDKTERNGDVIILRLCRHPSGRFGGAAQRAKKG